VSSDTLQEVSVIVLAMVLIVASLLLKQHLINWLNVAISKTFGIHTVSAEEYEKQKEEYT
jgi:hypothetical protein